MYVREHVRGVHGVLVPNFLLISYSARLTISKYRLGSYFLLDKIVSMLGFYSG